MQVRVVGMMVVKTPVRMAVGMGFARRQVPGVVVLVVLIVTMSVLIGERFVNVPVFVPLGEMEPDAGGHERGADDES